MNYVKSYSEYVEINELFGFKRKTAEQKNAEKKEKEEKENSAREEKIEQAKKKLEELEEVKEDKLKDWRVSDAKRMDIKDRDTIEYVEADLMSIESHFEYSKVTNAIAELKEIIKGEVDRERKSDWSDEVDRFARMIDKHNEDIRDMKKKGYKK